MAEGNVMETSSLEKAISHMWQLLFKVIDSLLPHGLQHIRLSYPSLIPWVYSAHVHWISDAIQPLILCHPFSSCPQSFPASRSFPMSRLFTSGWVLELQLQHQSFQWIFRVSCFPDKVIFLASTLCLSDSFIGLSCGKQSELILGNKRASPRCLEFRSSLFWLQNHRKIPKNHGSHQWQIPKPAAPEWLFTVELPPELGCVCVCHSVVSNSLQILCFKMLRS